MLRTTTFAVTIISAFTASALALGQNTGPVIDSVTMRVEMQRHQTVYPEFHTPRTCGNELAETIDGPRRGDRDSPEQQIKGVIYPGGWPCGPES
jgi:hypothetical protein